MMRVKLNEAPFYLDSESVQWVKSVVHHMSIDEQLYQLIYWVPKEPLANPKHYGHPIGGIYQYKQTKEELYHQNRQWQMHPYLPLLIGADVQSGSADLVEKGSFIASPMKVCATNNEREAYELGNMNAVEASALGINHFFAPVMDRVATLENLSHHERRTLWTEDDDCLKKMVISFMQGLSDSDVLAVASHFPAYRLSSYKTRDEWMKSEGERYRYLIHHDLSMLLISHEFFEKQCHHAETIFGELSDLLRQELHYNGVVMSPFIQNSIEEDNHYAKAIQMGCDMVLTEDVQTAFKQLKEGLQQHLFSLETLYNAVLRIVGVKAKLGFGEDVPFLVACDKKTQLQKIHPKQHYLLQDRISDEAITLVNDEHHLLPLDMSRDIYIVPVTEEDKKIARDMVALWKRDNVKLGSREDEEKDEALYIFIHSTEAPLPDDKDNHLVIMCQLPYHHPVIPSEIVTYDAHLDTMSLLIDKLCDIDSFKGRLPFTCFS